MLLCEKICKLQEESGLKESVLAKKLGVSPTTVNNWITGKTKPMRVYIEKLAEFFGIPEEELMEDDE